MYVYGAENRRTLAAIERLRGRTCPHGSFAAAACHWCVADAKLAVDADEEAQELQAKVDDQARRIEELERRIEDDHDPRFDR